MYFSVFEVRKSNTSYSDEAQRILLPPPKIFLLICPPAVLTQTGYNVDQVIKTAVMDNGDASAVEDEGNERFSMSV